MSIAPSAATVCCPLAPLPCRRRILLSSCHREKREASLQSSERRLLQLKRGIKKTQASGPGPYRISYTF